MTLRNVLTGSVIALATVSVWAQPVDAEVRKVDKDAKKITLKHGPIKNLDMPAMSMAYQVKDPSYLDKVKAGDLVVFTADKVNGAYTITSLDLKK